MPITRRQSLGLMGSALALPYLLLADGARAAPISVLKHIRLGKTQPGGKSDAAIAALPGNQGGFLACWINYRTYPDFRAFCQYFNNSGNPLSDPIRMGGAAGQTDGTPAGSARPVAFPNGTALIIFTAPRDGSPGEEGDQVWVQRMSAGREKVGVPIRINTLHIGGCAIVHATRLTNGNVLVAWQHAEGTPDSIDVRCRVIDNKGVGISPERRATKTAGAQQIPKDLAALPNGKSVLSYAHLDLVDKIWRLELQRLTAAGVRIGDPILIKKTSSDKPFGAAAVASFVDAGRHVAPDSNARSDHYDFVDSYYKEKAGDPNDVYIFLEVRDKDGKIIFPHRVLTVHGDPVSNSVPGLLPVGTQESLLAWIAQVDERSILSAAFVDNGTGDLPVSISPLFSSPNRLDFGAAISLPNHRAAISFNESPSDFEDFEARVDLLSSSRL